jgi:hypothetical protein
MMNITSTPSIIQTERGLTISGTRITLYDVIDYLTAGWPPHLIKHWLPLTEFQLNQALDYIKNNRSEVEAEYQKVLRETEELRQYYEEKNREHLAQIAQLPPKSGQEEVYAKLQACKKKLGLIP